MRKFAFRLEKVLNLRRQETEQVRRALGMAIAAQGAARSTLERAHALLLGRVAEASQKECAGVTGFEFAARRSHIRYLQSVHRAAEVELAAARTLTETRRIALVEAKRREKTLERLRQRRLEVYDVEALRDEQKELDEFGDRQGLNIRVLRFEI